MGLTRLKKLKIFESNRYYYYQYRNVSPQYVENKDHWSGLLAKVFPEV